VVWTNERLVRFIREHDCEAQERDGKIYALDKWVNADGTSGEKWMRVGANIKAVKRFLGY
jgi:hypothetical protein